MTFYVRNFHRYSFNNVFIVLLKWRKNPLKLPMTILFSKICNGLMNFKTNGLMQLLVDDASLCVSPAMKLARALQWYISSIFSVKDTLTFIYTVKPVLRDHLRESQNVVSLDGWSFYTDSIYVKCTTEGSKINGFITQVFA